MSGSKYAIFEVQMSYGIGQVVNNSHEYNKK